MADNPSAPKRLRIEGAVSAPTAAGVKSMQLGLTTIEVEDADVQRLILQYLQEQGLVGAMRALQRESGVALTAIEARDALAADVRAGRWDAVLPTVPTCEWTSCADTFPLNIGQVSVVPFPAGGLQF